MKKVTRIRFTLSRTGEGSSRVADYVAIREQRQNSTYAVRPSPPLKVVLPKMSKTA
jgi:hypothetical protein